MHAQKLATSAGEKRVNHESNKGSNGNPNDYEADQTENETHDLHVTPNGSVRPRRFARREAGGNPASGWNALLAAFTSP